MFRGKHWLILGKRTYLPDEIRRILETARTLGEEIADNRPEFAQYEPIEADRILTAETIRDRVDNWSECGWADCDHKGQQHVSARFLIGMVESIWKDMDALRRTSGHDVDVPDCPLGKGDAHTATEADYLNALRVARRWCNEWIKAERPNADEPPNADPLVTGEGSGGTSKSQPKERARRRGRKPLDAETIA